MHLSLEESRDMQRNEIGCMIHIHTFEYQQSNDPRPLWWCRLPDLEQERNNRHIYAWAEMIQKKCRWIYSQRKMRDCIIGIER